MEFGVPPHNDLAAVADNGSTEMAGSRSNKLPGRFKILTIIIWSKMF